MTPSQFLTMHSESAAEFERGLFPASKPALSSKPGRPSKGGRKLEPKEQKRRHMQAYRQRRKARLDPLPKPWDYLCSAEVKAMAWQAYRVASWEMHDALRMKSYTHQELRELFAQLLGERFTDALSAHAVTEGMCWPVTSETPPYRDFPRVWQSLLEDVPSSWRPEYPLYEDKLKPASQDDGGEQ